MTDDENVDWEASDIVFDHDAILIGEDGAATPAQGVGLMVNAAAGLDGAKIDVMNCSIDDDVDRDLAWSAESMLRAVERKERLPLLRRIIQIITGEVQGGPTPDITEGVALNAEDQPMDKAQFEELSGKVAALTETFAGLDDKIATAVGNALKPITDAQEASAQAAAAQAEADRLVLVNKVVEAGLLEEPIAKDASAAVLNALLAKPAEKQPAYRVNGAFKPAANGDKPAFTAPSGE